MLLYRKYNEKEKIDRAWFSSSNILYSECDDNENNLKTLRVTFKNGATYQYERVDVNDYVMFLHGGTDGSNGKALNKFIKPKYQFKRINDLDPSNIMQLMRNYKEEKSTEEPQQTT